MNAEVPWGAQDSVDIGRALRAIEYLSVYSTPDEVGASLFRLVSSFGVPFAADSHKMAALYALVYRNEVSTMIAKSPDSSGRVDVIISRPSGNPVDVLLRRVTGRDGDIRWAGVTLQFTPDGSFQGGAFTSGREDGSPVYGFSFDGIGKVTDAPEGIIQVVPGGARVRIAGLIASVTTPEGLDRDLSIHPEISIPADAVV